ncbi:MAG TPA: hypothetical protein PK854_01425 [Oscillospiraceae bacterium]|nr:hypothetical protein [Oscillospiraceae bacterium]HPS33912.1 hypothetical protein [Oscillospiraceae bacterium]
MKRVSTVFSILMVIFLLLACQSFANTPEVATSTEPMTSETTNSPEYSSFETTTSPESSVGKATEPSYDHTYFKTTQELLDYLKQNSAEKEINGVKIQNFIKDNQIAIYEPTFTPPYGFHLSSVEIWTVYGSYTYVTDDLIDYLDKIRSSARAAFESISHPQSPYVTKVESSIPSEMTTSSDKSSPSEDYSAFSAKNMIILQWCTAKSKIPGAALAWDIENSNLQPLGNAEQAEFYYSANSTGPDGIPTNYHIYWETDGYVCFASIPGALFSEENVEKICSFKPVTVPLG